MGTACSKLCGNGSFSDYYQLEERLGYGAYAQVRKCVHKVSKEERAVKIISKPYSKVDLEEELSLVDRLSDYGCPGIMQYRDFFEDQHFYYTVMEYCGGGDLYHRLLKPEPISEKTLINWMRQLLNAVKVMHHCKFVHRGLTAQTLMFHDSACTILKIVDFGLCCELRKGESLTEPCGVAEFLAPEMILREYGRKVDIWSCGVLLYLMLFGSFPFRGSKNQALFRSIIEDEPPWNRLKHNHSEQGVNLCKRLLMKNSKFRPSASAALEDPWFDSSLEDEASSYLPQCHEEYIMSSANQLSPRNAETDMSKTDKLLESIPTNGHRIKVKHKSDRSKSTRHKTTAERVQTGNFSNYAHDVSAVEAESVAESDRCL